MISTWHLCFTQISILSAFKIKFNFPSSLCNNPSKTNLPCPHRSVHQKSYWVLVGNTGPLAPTQAYGLKSLGEECLVKVILIRFSHRIWLTARLGNHVSLLNLLLLQFFIDYMWVNVCLLGKILNLTDTRRCVSSTYNAFNMCLLKWMSAYNRMRWWGSHNQPAGGTRGQATIEN